ncbi:metal binding domain of Ada-domain-containing protein [Nemania sp. NC0429]|nr:metal binding domain of Ada-domain-containing protein [Nemania sp. NC0429]
MAQTNPIAIPRGPSTSSTDEARWRLVLAHTPTSDFLYGVISTGIYCRPSCPSRRPRRSNARFFDSAASAAAAGFRACRRCKPESREPSDESPQASAEKQVEVACEYVRQRRGEAQLLDIAAHVGLSPRYLHGLFKRVLDTTPGAYAAAIRREGTGERRDVGVASAVVLDSTAPPLDLSNVEDFVHPGLPDGESCVVSFAEPNRIIDGHLPEDLGTLDYVDFNQNPYSDWFGDFSFDMVGLWGASGEFVEPQMNAYSSGCVDPSLLNSSNSPF